MNDQTEEHPWGAFLRVRARALLWLRDEMGESCEKIARTMSMDPVQVRLILDHVDSNPADYKTVTQRATSPRKVEP